MREVTLLISWVKLLFMLLSNPSHYDLCAQLNCRLSFASKIPTSSRRVTKMCDHDRNHQNPWVRCSTPRAICCNTPQFPGHCTSRSNSNIMTTTQTDTCHHHHFRSREIIRSNSAPAVVCCACDDGFCPSYSSNQHQIFKSTSRIELLLRELLDRYIEEECTICTESCTTSRTCSCWQRSERCTPCESDQQVVVSELMELLERLSSTTRTRESSGIVRWSERHRGGCLGCPSSHEVRYEAQALFEILLRITRRRSHSTHIRSSSSSRRRYVYDGERYEEVDSSLRRLIGQLLDELEGNSGCECQSCCEYLEVNMRRMRRELRGAVERTSSSREVVCSGSRGGCFETGGCSGCCDSTVSKTVVYGPPLRRPRTGNVHVGWSIR